MMPRRTKVLFVCLGNICRSPTAEGIFRHLVRERGLQDRFEIDSAGTGAWHADEPPDARMRRAARAQGFELKGRARAVRAGDYAEFDHIFAMDHDNLATLLRQAPAEHRDKVQLFRDHDPEGPGEAVPDPYYGGDDGFDEVVEIVARTSRSLLDDLQEHLPT